MTESVKGRLCTFALFRRSRYFCAIWVSVTAGDFVAIASLLDGIAPDRNQTWEASNANSLCRIVTFDAITDSD